jgi:hypothetical protein
MPSYNDLRDEFIARVVNGKTFADVGGLWGTVNEKASIAHQLDATAVTMIDVTPLNGDLWQKFDNRMQSLGIEKYHRISRDVCDLRIGDIGQPYDVVHCSGVLYHHPNPMTLLIALRRILSQNLILTSAITQEVIENENGRYQIPPSGVLFVPALSDMERSILSTYWSKIGVVAHGLTEKCTYNVADFGPWWWLPTAKALEAMCVAAGFKVVDRGLTWSNNACTLLLSV